MTIIIAIYFLYLYFILYLEIYIFQVSVLLKENHQSLHNFNLLKFGLTIYIAVIKE